MCFGEFMSMGDMVIVCSVCVFGLCVMGDIDGYIELVMKYHSNFHSYVCMHV